MKPRHNLLLTCLLVAGCVSLAAGFLAAEPVSAQDRGLRVVILRPGAGEGYYAGPDSPRTAVFVLGRVDGGEFALDQIEIQLAILHDGREVGAAHGVASASGDFSFLVATNPDGPEEVGRSSGNCYPCHGLAPVVLPAGPSVLRVTASDPTGRAAMTEREIGLERPQVAGVTVRIRVAGQPDAKVAGLPVNAVAGLYGWRSRTFSGQTDGEGQAVLRVEALTRQATRYRLNAPPAVVDGVLYQTGEPVEFDLPPGATAAGPLELTVAARLGRITGSITGCGTANGAPLTIRAVDLRTGRAFTTAAAMGAFALSDMPLSRYLVTVDTTQVGLLGCRPAALPVELTNAAEVTAGFTLESATGVFRTGTVRDKAGAAVPFAWLQSPEGHMAQSASPISGVFTWCGPTGGEAAVHVAAPGYWSRLLPARPDLASHVTLQPKPATRTVSWGANGQVVLPADSVASPVGDRIILQRGWLWGQGDGPLTIEMPEATLQVPHGRFALEYLPGDRAWLYLPEGEAQVESAGRAGVRIKAGEMLQFAGRELDRLRPVALDEAAATAWQSRQPAPFAFEAEPGLGAWLADAPARAGFALPPAGQEVRIAVLVLLGGGLVALGLIWRRRVRPRP